MTFCCCVFRIIVALCAFLPLNTEAVRGSDFLRTDMDVDLGGPGEANVMGMSREMANMCKAEWQLEPFDTSKVKDKRLRKHIQSILKDKPVTMTLSTLAFKSSPGFRAKGYTSDKKKIRARWSNVKERDEWKKADALSDSYDDVLRAENGDKIFDFEVKLPPVPGRKELPTLVYTAVMGMGSINPESAITRAPAQVTLYPDGRPEYSGQVKKTIDLGKAYASNPFEGNGLVDPQWAKGRAFFRKGRSVGQV